LPRFRKPLFKRGRNRFIKKGPLPFRYVLLLTFAFFTISTIVSLWIVDKELEPVLMSYAKSESTNLATLVINDAVNQHLKAESNNELFSTIPNTNKDHNIQLDTEEILRKQQEIERLILENLKKAEEGNLSVFDSLHHVEIKADEKESDGVVFSVP
jgi:hypothetical protein